MLFILPLFTLLKVYININSLTAEQEGTLRPRESVLSMLEEFAAVTRRQLSHFLPDGAYSAPATPEERQEMAHCKLNNLFGEACLGDLDFSLFKRRHSSVHNHSTVNMMKRSKPITKFLLKKSAAVQKRLVSFARRKAVSQRRTSPERESSDHRTTAVPPRTKSKE